MAPGAKFDLCGASDTNKKFSGWNATATLLQYFYNFLAIEKRVNILWRNNI